MSVGPVLLPGRVADAIVAALRAEQPDLEVTDRGSYLRVLAPSSCRLLRAAVEELIGEPFHLPRDLERVMPSFQGRLRIDEDQVTWLAPGHAEGAS